MKTIIFVIISLLSITSNLGYASVLKDASDQTQSTQKKIKWTWRKNFKDAELRNLVMAWNGSRLLFSVREKGDHDKSKDDGDVIIGLEHTGKPIRDWRVEGRINRLSLDGSGKRLLVELEDGRLLYYSDWERDEKPVIIKDAGPGAVLSPKGTFIGVVKNSNQKSGVQILSTKGEVIRDYTEQEKDTSNSLDRASSKWRIVFPFIESENRFLRISDDGRIFFNDEKNLLWKTEVQGSPLAVSSSILEGDILMISTTGDKNTIYFFNVKGELTGSAPFQGTASTLSCSNIGNICAAYGNGPKGQSISIYTPEGKEEWSYHIKEPADRDSGVFAVNQGNAIVAGIQDKGVWSIQALDDKGTPIWFAPIKEGLRDFSVSWDGKRIAVITEDARIVFYQIEE